MVVAKYGESTWFTDTGATNHVTPDINNLSIHSNYVGNDNFAIGNGKKLSISHTGSSQYLSDGSIVSLHNILHVSHISQDLLSVSQFTTDNNCHYIFTCSGFCVKENSTGKILSAE